MSAAWLTRPRLEASASAIAVAAPMLPLVPEGQLLTFGRLDRLHRSRSPAFEKESRLDQEILDRYAAAVSKHGLKKIDEKWSRVFGDAPFSASARMLLVLQRVPAPDFTELQLVDHAQARLSDNPERAIAELGNALTLLPVAMKGDRVFLISTLAQLGHLSPAATQAARASLFAAIEHSGAPVEGITALHALTQLQGEEADERFMADAREAFQRAHPNEDLGAMASYRLPASE